MPDKARLRVAFIVVGPSGDMEKTRRGACEVER